MRKQSLRGGARLPTKPIKHQLLAMPSQARGQAPAERQHACAHKGCHTLVAASRASGCSCGGRCTPRQADRRDAQVPPHGPCAQRSRAMALLQGGSLGWSRPGSTCAQVAGGEAAPWSSRDPPGPGRPRPLCAGVKEGIFCSHRDLNSGWRRLLQGGLLPPTPQVGVLKLPSKALPSGSALYQLSYGCSVLDANFWAYIYDTMVADALDEQTTWQGFQAGNCITVLGPVPLLAQCQSPSG